MYLQNINSGTAFKVTLEDGTEYQGEHDGNVDHLNFYLYCPDILKNLSTIATTTIAIEFIHRDVLYNFYGKVLGKSERPAWNRETVDMVVKTPIKEIPRREDFRVTIGIQVRIYAFIDSPEKIFTGEQICEAVSDDISKSGTRIWSDRFLDVPINTLFTLEFSKPLRATYRVQAKLMRSQQNTATRTYNYDYGFAFDYSRSPDQKDKLIMEALEAKLRSSR